MAKIVVISKYRYIEISNTLRRMASLVSRLSTLDSLDPQHYFVCLTLIIILWKTDVGVFRI